mmetsp:Transcript_20934/g.67533  ORF Transcript_20934/g.67533 Transcript_20934/m.67533 type:complete len:250 (-) Transcript_20934:27-776(-)
MCDDAVCGCGRRVHGARLVGRRLPRRRDEHRGPRLSRRVGAVVRRLQWAVRVRVVASARARGLGRRLRPARLEHALHGRRRRAAQAVGPAGGGRRRRARRDGDQPAVARRRRVLRLSEPAAGALCRDGLVRRDGAPLGREAAPRARERARPRGRSLAAQVAPRARRPSARRLHARRVRGAVVRRGGGCGRRRGALAGRAVRGARPRRRTGLRGGLGARRGAGSRDVLLLRPRAARVDPRGGVGFDSLRS